MECADGQGSVFRIGGSLLQPLSLFALVPGLPQASEGWNAMDAVWL